MHDTAIESGRAFFSTYFDSTPLRVLDVGALDVNGSLRPVAPAGSFYVGVDLTPGAGVDVVVDGGRNLPFAPDSFDVCVSTSCFEHDGMFWHTFGQMAEVTRHGGFLYVSAPSNGPYHSYPHDNWRFYPDAGLALAAWARRQGQPIHLIESGILRRRGDVWNDFVAVFQKHDAPPPRERFMLDAFPDAMNVRRLGADGVTALEAATEDQSLCDAARLQAEALAAEARRQREEAAGLRAALDARGAELRQAREETAGLRAMLDARGAELRQAREEAAGLRAALDAVQAQLAAVLNSTSWRITGPLRHLSAAFRGGSRR